MALLKPQNQVQPQSQAQEGVVIDQQPVYQEPTQKHQSAEDIAAANAAFMGQSYQQSAPQAEPVYQQAPVQQPVYQQAPVQQPVYQQPAPQGHWVEAPFQQEANHFQAPAVQQQSTSVVAATRQAASAAPDLGEAGFGGLSIGARSFPIISLKNDGVFEDSDGKGYGKELRCRLINSRLKIRVQGTKFENGKTVEEGFYTYDNVTTTNGRSVAEEEAVLAGKGFSIARREYTDVLVVMDAAGQDYDGELRILSVAPTSRERLAGKIQALAIKNGWRGAVELVDNVGNYVLHIKVGDKVTNAVQPFYPWEFTFQK